MIDGGMRSALVLCQRDLKRFLRQPTRIAAAIGTPALLWLLIGSGFTSSFAPPDSLQGTSYSTFLLPGMMALVAIFAAIFSSVSIIEDRNEGWLQAVLVSPAPRWSIALGRSLSGAVVAWIQAAVLIPLVWFSGHDLSFGSVMAVMFALAVLSIAMTAMGVALAWRCETTAGFHAIMNLLFMPMWLLSGAFFPVEGASNWLGVIASINPLTWSTESVRSPFVTGAVNINALLASLVFGVLMLGWATQVVSKTNKAH